MFKFIKVCLKYINYSTIDISLPSRDLTFDICILESIFISYRSESLNKIFILDT